jgi:hypothetical protein
VIVPAAIAAGIATSGGPAPGGSSLLAMTGARPGGQPGMVAARPQVGRPLTGAARSQVGALNARRALADQAAERAAARRAARRAAERRAAQQAAAQAAATPSRGSAGSGSQGSPPAQASGSPQHIALAMLGSFGWPSSQFGCLQSLWNVESGWDVHASNPSSGAYGIPQALPGSKMASAGPDWQTSAATQIRWGLGYIRSLYGSPCGAWGHEQADGWY